MLVYAVAGVPLVARVSVVAAFSFAVDVPSSTGVSDISGSLLLLTALLLRASLLLLVLCCSRRSCCFGLLFLLTFLLLLAILLLLSSLHCTEKKCTENTNTILLIHIFRKFKFADSLKNS
jgi:hypothetical protein